MFLATYQAAGQMRQDMGADIPGRWLANTPMLQHDNPKVRIQAQRLTQLKATPAEKAVACFQFIRSLPFKSCGDPARATAPKVLKDGAGDCHTKGTLFVALLRSIGIPARIHLVALRPAFLYGIISTEAVGIGHAFAEVFLDGRWHSVDAYAVDIKLGLAARIRLLKEGLRSGYIVHMKGQVAWDGSSDAFGHFSPDDPASMPIEDFGVFDDPHQYYAGRGTPVPTWAEQARWSISTALINRRIKALRRSISLRPAETTRRSEGGT